MKIEINKKYRCLINGCVFRVIGLSRFYKNCNEKNCYFDIEILEPKEKKGYKFSHSKSLLENLQIEEIN